MSKRSAPPTPDHVQDLAAEVELLSPDTSLPVVAPPPIEPHHDAVDRWFITETGGLPSPATKRKWKSRIEKLVNRTEADDERDFGDLLFTGDDPEEDRLTALTVGVDLSGDPAWQRNKRLYDDAKRRAGKRRPKPFDPAALSVALSHKREKILRKMAKSSETESKSGSRKARKDLARSASRDASIILDIQGFLEVDISVRLTCKKREVVRPVFISSPTTPGTATTHDPRDAVVWLPHWEKASLDLRAMAMGIASAANGARDFTLHLDDDVIRYAHGDGDMKFARRMRRRIEDQLAKAFKGLNIEPPPFAFFVEQGLGQRPHLHGFIFIPEGVKPPFIRNVLRDAGGHGWKPAGKDKTQAEIGTLYEPVGWVGYCTKFSKLTKDQIGDNTFAASRAIRKMGRAWYDDVRKARGLLLPRKAVAI